MDPCRPTAPDEEGMTASTPPSLPAGGPAWRIFALALVATAILFGAWSLLHAVQRMALLANAYGSQGLDLGGSWPWTQSLRSRLPEADRFLFTGDQSRLDRPSQQRAIWERAPENRCYYANYILHLIECPDNLSPAQRAHLEEELRRGEALDPENALYNYLLAFFWMERAATIEQNVMRPDGTTGNLLQVNDRALLEQAIQEIFKANQKPRLQRYLRTMWQARLQHVPPPEHLEDSIRIISLLAGQILPDLQRWRALASVTADGARLLASEGRTEDARRLLETYERLGLKLTEDSWCMVDVLVAVAILGIGQREGVAACSELDGDAAARDLAEHFGQRLAHYNAWNARRRTLPASVPLKRMLRQHGSSMVGLLLPALGEASVSCESLAPSRALEQTILELVCSWVLLAIWWVALLVTGILALVRTLRGSGGFWPAPDRTLAMQALVLGLCLPPLLYFLYSRGLSIAGRDFSVHMLAPRMVLELALVCLTTLCLTIPLTLRWIRSQCPNRTPNHTSGEALRICFALELVSSVAILSIIADHCLGIGVLGGWWILPFAVAALFTLLLVTRAGFFCLLAVGCQKRDPAYGTAARGLLPVLALAVLLWGGLICPHLERMETRCLQSDTLLYSPPQSGEFTPAEARVTDAHRQGIL